MQINESKKLMRAKYKSIRTSISTDEKNKLCRKISQAFLVSNIYKNSDSVFIYVSSEIEVDTHLIISFCFADKKNVYVPRCIEGTSFMKFYEITSFEDLETGAYGILEPKNHCLPAEISCKGICVVPALAYDLNGYRLGFGKGYYDRFLCGFTGKKIGLCYESCICSSLPHDEYDIVVDMLISDERIYVFE